MIIIHLNLKSVRPFQGCLLEVHLGDAPVVLEIAEAGAGKIRQEPGAVGKRCRDGWLKMFCNEV